MCGSFFFCPSYPDSFIIRAGEHLRAVTGELHTLHPTEMTAAIRLLCILFNIPKLENKKHASSSLRTTPKLTRPLIGYGRISFWM